MHKFDPILHKTDPDVSVSSRVQLYKYSRVLAIVISSTTASLLESHQVEVDVNRVLIAGSSSLNLTSSRTFPDATKVGDSRKSQVRSRGFVGLIKVATDASEEVA